MTTTPHGQVPEALRLAAELEREKWHVPAVVMQAAAEELRRLHAYCQELESQVIRDCMTHGQTPTEIERVAGDVLKNGAELNMSAQQPAPAGATQDDGIAARRAKYLRNDTDAGRAYVAQYLRSMGQHYFDDYIQTDLAGDFACALAASLSTPQPAPATQQAGVALSDDLRDRLVAISEAIADQDDRAAQAMLREILKAPQPSPTAQAAPALAENGHLTQAGHDLLMGATLAGATLVSKGRLVGDTAQAAESVPAVDYPPLPDLDDTLWIAIGQHRRAITNLETSIAAKAVDTTVYELLRAYVDADRAARKQGGA